MEHDQTPANADSSRDGSAFTEGLGSTAREVGCFIDPAWIKTSDWPANIIPAGAIVIDQASENGDCTVKGFYEPATGEFHIQEVLHAERPTGWFCSKCGTDRTKAACPKGHSAALTGECPMVGTAA